MAVPKRLRYEVLRRDNFTCRYCRSTENELTVDHVVPVVLGGRDEPSNLVAACRDCNAGKSASSPDQPLIGDVAADGLRWAAAMREVERRSLDRYVELDGWTDSLLWNWDVTPDEGVRHPDGGFESFPRPSDQDSAVSLHAFLRAGLPTFEVMRLMDKTLSSVRIKRDSKWQYFCGCCWSRLRDMQAEARELIEQGVV